MSLAATILAISACEEKLPSQGDEPKDPAGPTGLTAPVLGASAQSVTLAEANEDQTALTLNWTDAVEGLENAVAEYTLYVNAGAADIFSEPQTYDLGIEKTKAFTNKELNDLALQFGIAEAATGNLKFLVYAEADGFEAVQSNELSVSVTTYKETFVGPANLYMLGSATDFGWDIENALVIPMKSGEQNIYEATGITIRLTPNDVGFKFFFSGDWSDSRFFGQDPSGDFGAMAVKQGDGFEFQPALHGYSAGIYDMKIDANQMKLTITRTGDLPTEVQLGDNLYALGGCFSWGWAFTGTPLQKTSEKVYEASSISMAFGDNDDVGFKVFLNIDQWSPYYAQADGATKDNFAVQLVTEGEVPQFYPGQLGYDDGTYDIKLDLNEMKLTLTQVVSPLSMHGTATPVGWDSRMEIPHKEGRIWEVTGVYLTMEEGASIKIYANTTDWWPYYGQVNPADEFGIITEVPDDATKNELNDPTFYPAAFGYTSGTYTITVNLETMRLTLTKES